MKIKQWIDEDNLIPVLEKLSLECGYEFDSYDLDAFKLGIQPDNHFDYLLEGTKSKIAVRVFYESGTSVYEFSVEMEEKLKDRISMLLELAQEYKLKGSALQT